jgi:hypothetical protein
VVWSTGLSPGREAMGDRGRLLRGRQRSPDASHRGGQLASKEMMIEGEVPPLSAAPHRGAGRARQTWTDEAAPEARRAFLSIEWAHRRCYGRPSLEGLRRGLVWHSRGIPARVTTSAPRFAV